MKIQVSDSSLAEDLAGFLRDSCCIVKRTGKRTLEVRFDESLPDDAAVLELDLYLALWQVRHPGAWAARTEDA
jgi:hypothetical protein